MVRVYLDWNIFSYLKNLKTSNEPYITLNQNLSKHKEDLLVPYTSAHLTDLITSYKQSEKGKQKTLEDLQYLEELTNNLCIIYDYKEQKTYPDRYSIKDYFEQLLDSDTLMTGNFENLFSSLKVTEFDGLTNSFFDLLKTLPADIDTTIFQNINSKYQSFKDAFQQTATNSSYYNLLNDTFKLLSQYNSNPKTYRNIRNVSLDELKLSHDYTQSENPIDDISKNLENSAFKKSFQEFASENLKNYFKDKEPSRFDSFTNHYIILDFLGYYRDSHFKNLLQDAFHAYYGAHCDFFVTDDDNTYHKAKVIYDHFNIKTVVCKSQEFNSQLYEKIVLNSSSEKPLIKVISEILNSSFVITNQHDDEFNPVDIYKIDHYVLEYFNRLQVTHNADHSACIFLYKNSKNYSSFYFFKEIETLTNKIVRQFGVDHYNRFEYKTETENDELMKDEWKGRTWLIQNTLVRLRMCDAPFGLTLTINLEK
ncbi:MAG: hypothetical protein J0I09_03675 [Sphingobacteriia bacterium]|nr:hypothetical protein [Sphingobacteriia bacterium]